MNDDAFSESEREAIVASMMASKSLQRADAERLLDSIDHPAKRNPLLEQQWVDTLFATSRALRQGRAEPVGLYETVFWIRLYGVVTELLPCLEKTAGLETETPVESAYFRYFTLKSEAFAACQAVRNALTDEELIYVAYLRHTHAHVYQAGFEYGVQRGNPGLNQPATLRTNQMVATVRRHVDVDEVRRIVDDIGKAFRDDASAILAHFVRKVWPSVDWLREAIRNRDAEQHKLIEAG